MDKEIEKQGRKCFIITPIGNEDSETFRKAKGVIESVIKPVLKGYGFDDIKPAYEINEAGLINTQIINRIIDDDLVIANLTDNNPNVMYELCLRHVVAKPTIHICENGTTLPFDIKDSRTIFYENDMLGVEELKGKIQSFLSEIAYENDCMDNPIYVAYRQGKLLKETQGTEANEILKLLVDISGKVSELKTTINNERQRQPIITVDDSAYAVGQLVRDTFFIKKEDLEEVKTQRQKMRVYELAKKLNTTSKAIMIIAQIVGVDARAMNSSLEYDDICTISDYILDKFVK